MTRTLSLAAALLVLALANAQPVFTDGSSMLSNTAHSGGCMAITDMDGDGLDDIIQLDQGKHVHVLYQEADGSFTAYDYGAVDNTSQWGWAIGDLDNDGHKDICSGAYGATHMVSISARGVFTTSDLDGPDIFTQCMSMGDMDNDGRVDVLACHDDGHPNIWFTNTSGIPVNNNDYIDWTTSPSSDMSGNYGSCFVDFDNDGDQDFYISHCRQGVPQSSDPRRWNRLFVNDGTNNYTDEAVEYGVQDHEQSWTTDFGDYDNDGDMDMFTTEHSTGNKIFENDGTGHFTEVPSSTTGLGATDFPLQGMFRDLDNDGFLDILVAGGESHYYHGNGDGSFTEMAGLFGTSPFHGFAFGDLNRDGFEDVYSNYASNHDYVTPSGVADKLWLNTPNGNHFFRVRLQGTTSNRDAIGARVTITGPWGTQVREVRSGESYGLVNSFALGFGLGAETMVPTMTVRWPSGSVETFNDLHADQEVTVVEGECISPNIAITATPEGMVCPGTPVELVASSGSDITWNTGGTGQSITVNGPGTYWAMAAGTGDCSTQATADVVAVPNVTPVVSVQGDTVICPQDQVVLTSSPGDTYQWSNGSDQQSITVSTSGDYAVSVDGECGMVSSAPVTIVVRTAPEAPTSSDVTIPTAGTAVLTATGDSLLWYNVATGGTPIGTGSPWTTPTVNANTIFWCADLGADTLASFQGGKMDKSVNGQYQNNNNYYLEFSTVAPLRIRSAKVYANGAGIREVGVYYQGTNTLAASGSYSIPDGESVVQLDLVLPEAGDYDLRMISGNPQLWRDGQGSNPQYPYPLGSLGSITGSNAGEAYYYYFYDWEVSQYVVACESLRTPVEVFVGPTSINTNTGITGFRIFPNPATDNITISGPLPAGATVAEFLDVAGRVCLSSKLFAKRTVIDVSELAPGTYTVRVRGENGIGNSTFVKR